MAARKAQKVAVPPEPFDVSDLPPGPWGNVPDTAEWFIAYKVVKNSAGIAAKVKQQVIDGDGVGVEYHSIEQLSVPFIRQWGSGYYNLQWYGTSEEGKRMAGGNSPAFELHPVPGVKEPGEDAPEEDEEEEDDEEGDEDEYEDDEPVSAQLIAPAPGLDSLSQALVLMQTLGSLKDKEVRQSMQQFEKMNERGMQMQTQMINLIMGREERQHAAAVDTSAQVGAINQIITALKQQGEAIQKLGAKLQELEAEPPTRDASGNIVLGEGAGMGEMAAAAAINAAKEQLPAIIGGISAVVMGYGQKMAADAEEKKKTAARAAPVAPQQAPAQQVSKPEWQRDPNTIEVPPQDAAPS